MSASLRMRVMLAATALCVAPAIANAQAPQTKRCKDGSTSTRSTFACFGHGGVDTAPAVEQHRAPEAVQAGTPRASHAKAPSHKASKAAAHHAKVEHREAKPRVSKKKPEERRGWLPWRHKNKHDEGAKKTKKKHADDSRLPVPKHPNGRPS